MTEPMRTNPNIKQFSKDHKFRDPFESLFSNLLANFWGDNFRELNSAKPDINIVRAEDGNQYKLQIGVAGYNKDDIKVYLSEQSGQSYVVVQGQHKEQLEEGEEYVKQNIQTSEFNVSYPVAKGFELGECHMENGLLTISFNKTTPEKDSSMKQIEIQ